MQQTQRRPNKKNQTWTRAATISNRNLRAQRPKTTTSARSKHENLASNDGTNKKNQTAQKLDLDYRTATNNEDGHERRGRRPRGCSNKQRAAAALKNLPR